ncbi:helix-turn-helix domain-containing protein [Fulvivirga lutimaris]|uniref:helix-turn-helix domain-containing protein n=1 Tax=Fulvivirga lutimaris TaxID=1819566 RepID=UPI0012BBC072
MKLIQSPSDRLELSSYVDHYQYFKTDKPTYFKTVPNGRLDFYLIKKGTFSYWDYDAKKLIESESFGYFPILNSTALYIIPGNLEIFNIKFRLPVLCCSTFNQLLQQQPLSRFKIDFLNEFIATLDSKFLTVASEINTPFLDESISALIETAEKDERLSALFQLFEHYDNSLIRTSQVASRLHITVKTLERLISKNLNMTPKKLWSIIRFQSVSEEIHGNEKMNFKSAYDYGYHDQSHFIKECKKITGLAPREFFKQLNMPAKDVLFNPKD